MYLAISAATSADTVEICTSPDIKEVELPDVTWGVPDEEVFRGRSFWCTAGYEGEKNENSRHFNTHFIPVC